MPSKAKPSFKQKMLMAKAKQMQKMGKYYKGADVKATKEAVEAARAEAEKERQNEFLRALEDA